MFKETVKILAVCAAMAFAACAEAGEMRKKALVVMLDGCRADAAPNLRPTAALSR